MTFVYASIGRLVVAIVMRRYDRQLRIAGAVALGGVALGGAIGAYLLAGRDVEEG